MRDCRPAGWSEGEKESSHSDGKTVARAASYSVDVDAGYGKTYNLTDRDREFSVLNGRSTHFREPLLLLGSLSGRGRRALNLRAICVDNLHAWSNCSKRLKLMRLITVHICYTLQIYLRIN